MSKKELSPAKRLVMSIKMRSPSGMTLNKEDATIIIEGWKDRSREIEKRRYNFQEISDDVERRGRQIERDTPEAANMLRDAKANFKRSKNPVVKAKWARKVVLRSEYHTYLKNSQQVLADSVERIKDALEDIQVVGKLMEHRIKDAELYAEMNGGLKLVGKALVDARTPHRLPELEYQQFDFSMEQIEKQLGSTSDTSVIDKAKKIVAEIDK